MPKISLVAVMLRKGFFEQAIKLVQPWLQTATPDELTTWMADARAADLPRIRLLVRDLLSYGRHTHVGCPILAQATPPATSTPDSTFCFPQPELDSRLLCPVKGLIFQGWARPKPNAALQMPGSPLHDICVPWNAPSVAIALFTADSALLDQGEIDIPEEWWASLFSAPAGKLRLSASRILLYPTAIEAGYVMEQAVRGKSAPTNCLFLDDQLWAWAYQEASLFTNNQLDTEDEI